MLISRGEVIKTFSYINRSGAQNNPEIAHPAKKTADSSRLRRRKVMIDDRMQSR
jgi:hypothetical protein